MESIVINIPSDMLQTAFDNHITKLLGDTYDNPVKKVVDELIGYSSKHPIKDELKSKIAIAIEEMLKSEKFVTQVGEAFAKEIARREADRLKSQNR